MTKNLTSRFTKKTYIYNTNKQNYLSGIYNVEYPINNRKNRRKKNKKLLSDDKPIQ